MYLKKVYYLLERVKTFEILHVPREHSFKVDFLSKLVSSKRKGCNHTTILETLIIFIIEACETNIFVFSNHLVG